MSVASPRVLLRRIREALAREGDGQTRLDRIVKIVATNMVAEVCSIYLFARDGKTLELFATEGLNQASVHKASLAVGHGLVGRIAETGRPINTDDAARTPGFQFIPGTGEEVFRSFLGAPIRRQGHTLGVLVVQNQAARRYDEDEVDALELIATVIAEMTDAGALPDPTRPPVGVDARPAALTGVAAAEGVAIGKIVLHEPKIVLANPIAEDVDTERGRLREGMAALRGEVDRLIAGDGHGVGLHGPGEHRDVLDAYRMIANDRGWLRRLEAAVEQGLAAEAAVEKVQTETRARLERT
ncbi:MAG: GAF domain-containing protein, partial [Pseudomonadota bacterium]